MEELDLKNFVKKYNIKENEIERFLKNKAFVIPSNNQFLFKILENYNEFKENISIKKNELFYEPYYLKCIIYNNFLIMSNPFNKTSFVIDKNNFSKNELKKLEMEIKIQAIESIKDDNGRVMELFNLEGDDNE
jgi:hypothetical protein